MKTKKLLGIFFLFLCTITLVSCGDDEKQEIYSLSFEKGYYERPLLGAKNIPVRGGNRDYTVTVQNTDVLSIDIDLSSPIDMGNLVVKPKQKGETTITVKDNVTNETVDLKIKIVDSYLNLKVAHPAQVPYTGGENLFFINNAIEPMVNAGRPSVKILDDGWTVVTADGKPSAHFEHTVIVTDGAPLIVTDRPRIALPEQLGIAPL